MRVFKWHWLGLSLLLIITAIIYSDMWSAPYIFWDDEPNIFKNPYFQHGVWWWVWFEPYFGLYVPVTSSVWALLFFWGGGETWPFRALNLGLHLYNILFVYVFLRLLARELKAKSELAIFFAVSVFALHPLQVQAVAWISGGRDLLAAFFALASTCLFFGLRSRIGYCLALLMFVCALLSKPIVVVLPIALLVLNVACFRRPLKQSVLWLAPWMLASLVTIWLTQKGQGPYFVNEVAWFVRPVLLFDSLAFYIGKTLWPYPLAGNYDHTPLRLMSEPRWWVTSLVCAVFILSVTVYVWCRARRFSVLSWWLLFLLPVSGIVPFAYQNIGGVADHYNYLPMVGVAAFLLLLCSLVPSPAQLVPIALVALSALGYVSWRRLDVWQSNTNFFMDMARAAPNSYSTAIGMSVVMCIDVRDYQAGLEWTDKALKQKPGDILALANRSMCLGESGRSKQVLELERELLKLDRQVLRDKAPTPYSNLLTNMGRAAFALREFERGFQFICEAYRVLPSNPSHRQNLLAATELLGREKLAAECAP